jgi:hypothetical protein
VWVEEIKNAKGYLNIIFEAMYCGFVGLKKQIFNLPK